MAKLNPYICFTNKTEEAFTLYKSVFGGGFAMIMRFKDAPKEAQMGEPNGEKIMHISYPVGDTILMGSDAPESMGNLHTGNSFNISISAESEADADRIYNGLSDGGKRTMPMANTFWGSYFGMLTDKFGVQWMVSYDKNPGQ